VNLAQFIMDNMKFIADLDQQLSGMNLVVCNPPDPSLIKGGQSRLPAHTSKLETVVAGTKIMSFLKQMLGGWAAG
jgi:hypothetical protein